jgi:hypothetical protein
MNSTISNLSTHSIPFSFDISSLSFFHWSLIVAAIIIFITGIVGNALVILVVATNAHMRTITNIFILNLAIGDFLIILICLPPTIISDVTGYWWFGKMMCKIIPYIQVYTFIFSILFDFLFCFVLISVSCLNKVHFSECEYHDIDSHFI